MKQSHTHNRTFGYPAVLFIAFLLLPFVFSSFFVFPDGDDFSPALRASHLFDIIGGIDYMFSAWWKWSGRYAFSFFWVFLGDVAEYKATYTAAVLLSFALLWVGVFGIARELGKEGSKSQASFIATFWLFAVLCTHGTVQQWYRLVELETLLAGYSFTLVYIWSLCRLWNSGDVTRSVKWFPVISCVLAAGFYEHSAPLVMAISVMAWLLSILYDHPSRKIYFLLVKISVVCFFIIYLARGNFRRQTKRGMTFALMLEQVLNAGRDWWKFIIPAYCNPIYLAALFAAVWITPRWKTPLTAKIPAALILGGSLVLFCGFSLLLTVVHALSDVTVGETQKIPANIAQYSVVFVFFALFACRDWLRLQALRAIGRPLSLFVVVAVLLAGDSNFFPILWNGIFGETSRYAEAYGKRKTVMARNAGRKLAVMPLLSGPVPFYGDTIQADFKAWPNKYAAPFYGLKELEARKPEAAMAYGHALGEGKIAWQDLYPDVRVAYVPSLTLRQDNETYRFDWFFIENESGDMPLARVAVFNENTAADAIAASQVAMKRIAANEWPFRRIFTPRQAWPFDFAGHKMFALPLPQLDSVNANAMENLLLSLNFRPFVRIRE